MSESLFSPLWYRVARRRPYLRRDVQVRQVAFRDQNWHLLSNTATGDNYRASPQAYAFIGRCDGLHSVQDIWDDLLDVLGDNAPTQDEIIQLIIQLDEHGIFGYEVGADAKTLIRRRDEKREKKRKGMVNPFAMRIPVGNPGALLRRLEWLCRPLVNVYAVWLWAAIVALGVVAAAANWSELRVHGMTHLASPHYLFLMWVCFPFIKAVHELAHALVVMRWGGEVRHFGFTLFLLVPAPYVDASDAGGFRHRSQRMLVGAAGIMAELILASLALFVWLNVQPGLVGDVAFVVMFIGCISTLIFNGNPLLPFDGYYVLCDLLDVPNLNTRSKALWNEFTRWLVLGVRGAQRPFMAKGEYKWLLAYFPASLVYRILISIAIVAWVGAKSFVLGALAALFVVISMFILPLWRTARELLGAASPGNNRARAAMVLTGLAVMTVVVTFVFPVPQSTLAQGVVWLPDQAKVRTEVDGFVREILVSDGEQVEAGQTLVILEDSALLADREAVRSQLERTLVERYKALAVSSERAQKMETEIARLRANLETAEEKIAALTVRSKVAGRLVMPLQQDLPGTFVRQGTNLGNIFGVNDVVIRAVVPEYDAALVRQKSQRITVRMSDRIAETHRATLLRDVPAATNELPSAALGDRGGGWQVVDPKDKDGLRALEPVVVLDLTVPTTALQRSGARAWVRFEHGTSPLVNQWYRRLRQVFLKQFNPVS